MVDDAIISTRHLSYTYSSGQLQKKALDDISLEITRHSRVAIVGFNGSGKTTLVQHFNGLLRPTHGEIYVDSINVGAREADLRALRQRVGMLFQFPETQLFARTVFADVAFGPQRMYLSRREVRSRVMSALAMVGMPFQEYAQRSPFDLSGGQRRRIALAGVLAMSPKILVLDEPSIGLDREGREELYSSLQRIHEEQGVTIILVSHDMTEVAALADWIFVLYQGKLVMQGTPRSVFTQREQLHTWGLAVPPLSELMTLLRIQGIGIPEDTLTLEEAFTYLAGIKGRGQ